MKVVLAVLYSWLHLLEKISFYSGEKTAGNHEGCTSCTLAVSTCKTEAILHRSKKILAAMMVASATP
jgi:hypothetical protein